VELIDIDEGVRGFLNSIIPALFFAAVLAGTTVMVIGRARLRLFSSRCIRWLSRIKPRSFDPILDRYDAKKLVPYVGLLLILLLLVGIYDIFERVGSMLPGRLGYRQPDLFVSCLLDDDQILTLWSFYPGAEKLYDLPTIAETVGRQTDERRSRVNYHARISRAKALLVFAAVLAVLCLRRRRRRLRVLGRFAIVFVLIAIVTSYCFYQQAYHHRLDQWRYERVTRVTNLQRPREEIESLRQKAEEQKQSRQAAIDAQRERMASSLFAPFFLDLKFIW